MHNTRSTFFLIVLCAVATWAHLAADVPLFAWSGESFLEGKNVPVSSALTIQDFESLLDAILLGRNMPSTFSSKQRAVKPELVILFIEPELRIDQIAAHANKLAHLKAAMQNEASSFYAPHVDFESSSSSLSTGITSASVLAKSTGASIIYVGKGSALLPELKRRVPSTQAVTMARLPELLRSNSAIFSNGVTDFLIVHLDNEVSNLSEKFENSDSIIKTVQDAIKTTSYMSFYTALSYADPNFLNFENSKKRVFLEAEFILDAFDDNNTNTTTQPNWFQYYFPGWFWEVAVLVVTLLPIVITGFCSILSIQVPENVIPQSKSKSTKKPTHI